MSSLVLLALAGGSGCGDRAEAPSVVDGVDEFGLPEIEIWREPSPSPPVEGVSSLQSPVDEALPEGDPDALYTNVYHISPSFFSAGRRNEAGELFTPHGGRSAKEIMESWGITFGPGASAIGGNQGGSQLIVRQTRDQMELVEALIEQMTSSQPKDLAFRIEIFEMPASHALKLQQSTEGTSDHRGEWEATLKLMGERKARFVDSAYILARSGQRSKVSAVEEVFFYLASAPPDQETKNKFYPGFEQRDVGIILEVDPVLQADEETVQVSVNLEYHSAPPTRREESLKASGDSVGTPIFHAKTIQSEVTIRDGQARLIGAWKPTGDPRFEKDDVRHLIFLKADLQPLIQIKKES